MLQDINLLCNWFLSEKQWSSGESYWYWQNLVSAVCHIGLERAVKGPNQQEDDREAAWW